MREHADGDFPFANDFNALVRDALEGSTQVESGCAVSDGGTDDMSVSVASGSVVIDGAEYSISSQSVSLASADADYPRYDLIIADSSGATDVTGTASSTPKAPSIPSKSVLLAIVEVPEGVSGVTDAEINDARVILDGIANTAIAALENLNEGNSFSGYPLKHGTDVDAESDLHHSRPQPGNHLTEQTNGSTWDVSGNPLQTIDRWSHTGTGVSKTWDTGSINFDQVRVIAFTNADTSTDGPTYSTNIQINGYTDGYSYWYDTSADTDQITTNSSGRLPVANGEYYYGGNISAFIIYDFFATQVDGVHFTSDSSSVDEDNDRFPLAGDVGNSSGSEVIESVQVNINADSGCDYYKASAVVQGRNY